MSTWERLAVAANTITIGPHKFQLASAHASRAAFLDTKREYNTLFYGRYIESKAVMGEAFLQPFKVGGTLKIGETRLGGVKKTYARFKNGEDDYRQAFLSYNMERPHPKGSFTHASVLTLDETVFLALLAPHQRVRIQSHDLYGYECATPPGAFLYVQSVCKVISFYVMVPGNWRAWVKPVVVGGVCGQLPSFGSLRGTLSPVAPIADDEFECAVSGDEDCPFDDEPVCSPPSRPSHTAKKPRLFTNH